MPTTASIQCVRNKPVRDHHAPLPCLSRGVVLVARIAAGWYCTPYGDAYTIILRYVNLPRVVVLYAVSLFF